MNNQYLWSANKNNVYFLLILCVLSAVTLQIACLFSYINIPWGEKRSQKRFWIPQSHEYDVLHSFLAIFQAGNIARRKNERSCWARFCINTVPHPKGNIDYTSEYSILSRLICWSKMEFSVIPVVFQSRFCLQDSCLWITVKDIAPKARKNPQKRGKPR